MKLLSFRDEKLSFRLLLGLILGVLVVTPILPEKGIFHIVMDLFLTGAFFVVIRMLSRNRLYAVLAGVSGATMVVALWAQIPYPSNIILIIGRVGGAIFFLLAVVTIFRYIAESQTVTREVLYAAIVVYLMIGILFAFIYSCLYIVNPASFDLPPEMNSQTWTFFYFSFVTLTTLGYGDISPLTQFGGVVAILEAIIGQLYLVIVVAWLVGMYVSRKAGEEFSKED